MTENPLIDKSAVIYKEFANGDVAVDEGNGLVYETANAVYSVQVDFPQRPLSAEPYGVDLVRMTHDAEGQERQQRSDRHQPSQRKPTGRELRPSNHRHSHQLFPGEYGLVTIR